MDILDILIGLSLVMECGLTLWVRTGSEVLSSRSHTSIVPSDLDIKKTAGLEGLHLPLVSWELWLCDWIRGSWNHFQSLITCVIVPFVDLLCCGPSLVGLYLLRPPGVRAFLHRTWGHKKTGGGGGGRVANFVKNARARYKMPQACTARSQNARSCYINSKKLTFIDFRH